MNIYESPYLQSSDITTQEKVISHLNSIKQEAINDWANLQMNSDENHYASEEDYNTLLFYVFNKLGLIADVKNSDSIYIGIKFGNDATMNNTIFMRVANHYDKHSNQRFSTQLNYTPTITRIFNFRFEENADSYIPNSTIRYSKDKTKGGEAIVDTIIINRKHLDNKNDFIKIVDSIIDLAKSGKYKYPFFISDNKQNHLELTESQLIKIIKTCIDEEIAKNNCRKKQKENMKELENT